MIQLTECPRDAMQGLSEFVPTDVKAHYMNLLLQVGFYRLDFGSFVSPKAIPQMRDTALLVDQLHWEATDTQLLAIVANERGAQEGAAFDAVHVLGFPLSVSETFQIRNTNSTIKEALKRTEAIANICFKAHKIPLVYLSMGFGNPYGDPWSEEIVLEHARTLADMGIQEIMLADTIGNSDIDGIRTLFPALQQALPELSIGLHLHSHPADSYAKIQAAYEVGCRKFDSALRGFGGCPMAKDDLVGNIATETIFQILQDHNEVLPYNIEAWKEALQYSMGIFH